MANALKIISLLLSYPTKELLEGADELHQALSADKMANGKTKKLLKKLIDEVCSLDLYEAQERYVLLFDRTRTLSLHLFEHVHGESRDRGQAMVDLAAMYDREGFEIDAKELPDYLPLFLEYLSLRPAKDIADLMGQVLHIISAIRKRLKKRDSIYENAFLALEQIAGIKADAKAVSAILEEPADDPNDLEALDKIWEDEAVMFGGGKGNDACGPDRLRTQIRAAQRPAGVVSPNITSSKQPQINEEHKNG